MDTSKIWGERCLCSCRTYSVSSADAPCCCKAPLGCSWLHCVSICQCWVENMGRSLMSSRCITQDESRCLICELWMETTLFSCPPQKWKLKSSVLQHHVSGLCLDSQTPMGPLVINQCRAQLASQSWEPQIITWASAAERARGRSRTWTCRRTRAAAHCGLTEAPKTATTVLYLCDVTFKTPLHHCLHDKSC